jgi:hypothetical protein
MKGVFCGAPVEACRVFGIPVTLDSAAPELLSGSLVVPDKEFRADLVMRIGPGRLAHLEYERRPSGNLVERVLHYRSLIMLRNRKAILNQLVIVLGRGSIEDHPDPVMRMFWRTVRLTFMPDLDPAVFLNNVSLAPCAVLGRGSPEERERVFACAVEMIWSKGGERTYDLLDYATALARITLTQEAIQRVLKGATVSEKIVEDYAGEMFKKAGWGMALSRKGRKEGREEGRRAEREQMLIILLR